MSRDVKPITLNFKGGLNTFSDMSAVSDNQLVEALNFDMDLDGSLRSRPPFTESASFSRAATGTEARFLGWYYEAGKDYLIFSEGSRTAAWDKQANSFITITTAYAASAMVQWQNRLWIIPPWVSGTTLTGGFWTASSGTYTAEANMPAGSTMVAYKERLFIARGPGSDFPSRLFYSNVFGSSSLWNASPSFQEVGSGDGQAIVYLTIYYSSLLIFRSESIWTWAYSASPDAGQISVLVPGVGLSSPDAVSAYENTIYFMYDSKAYAFVQNRAEHINLNVPFRTRVSSPPTVGTAASTFPAVVSVFNQRVIFSYFGSMYIFNLLTSAWTEWVSTAWGAIGQLRQSALDDIEVGYALTAWAWNGVAGSQRILRIEDRTTSAAESMVCSLQTKNYSFQVPSNFKILHRWGLDVRFRQGLKAWATPIALFSKVTWQTVKAYTWGQVAGGTWQYPVPSDPISADTDLKSTVGGTSRKYVKLRKRLRFRQIYFRVELETSGDSTTGPVQIYAILVFVDTREWTVKQIS